jgi:hypothetical protein
VADSQFNFLGFTGLFSLVSSLISRSPSLPTAAELEVRSGRRQSRHRTAESCREPTRVQKRHPLKTTTSEPILISALMETEAAQAEFLAAVRTAAKEEDALTDAKPALGPIATTHCSPRQREVLRSNA